MRYSTLAILFIFVIAKNFGSIFTKNSHKSADKLVTGYTSAVEKGKCCIIKITAPPNSTPLEVLQTKPWFCSTFVGTIHSDGIVPSDAPIPNDLA
jgi:hypothetical protein